MTWDGSAASEPFGRIRFRGDRVQRPRHVVAQLREIGLSARRGVCLGADRGGIAIGPLPIHVRHRDGDDVEFGGGIAAPHRHREHEPIVESSPLAVGREDPSVLQEDAEQRRAGVLRGRGQGNGHRQEGRGEAGGSTACGKPVDEPSKACERHDRDIKSSAGFHRIARPGRHTCGIRTTLRLQVAAGQIESLLPLSLPQLH